MDNGRWWQKDLNDCSRWQVRKHFQHRARVQKQAVPTAVVASDPWLAQVKSLEPLQLEFRGLRGQEDQSMERPVDEESNSDVEGMELTAIRSRRRGVSTSRSGMSCPRPQIAGRRVLQPVSGDGREEPCKRRPEQKQRVR